MLDFLLQASAEEMGSYPENHPKTVHERDGHLKIGMTRKHKYITFGYDKMRHQNIGKAPFLVAHPASQGNTTNLKYLYFVFASTMQRVSAKSSGNLDIHSAETDVGGGPIWCRAIRSA